MPSFPGGTRKEEFQAQSRAEAMEEFFKPDGAENLPLHPYSSLRGVLDEAFEHASNGKGKERHGDDDAFENQVTCEIRRRVGPGYTKGQAVKKIYESERLPGERGIAELLGAINYIAAEIIVRREQSA